MDKTLNGPTGGLYEVIMTAHNTGQPTTISSIAPMSFDSIVIDAAVIFKPLPFNRHM